jgi:heat shock protein HslJ
LFKGLANQVKNHKTGKMKPIFISIFFFSLICISCGSSTNSTSSGEQDPHAKMHQEMHDELYQEQALSKLDGKWLIKQVYDMEIDTTQFEGKQPFMNIDLKKGFLNGNDGCNLFQGKVSVKKDKIIYGPTAGTLMACPNMEVSEKIMASFNEKELTFVLNDVLTLYEGAQKVMMLKRPE